MKHIQHANRHERNQRPAWTGLGWALLTALLLAPVSAAEECGDQKGGDGGEVCRGGLTPAITVGGGGNCQANGGNGQKGCPGETTRAM